MTERHFDGVEREQLCDLLDELGADAPTLITEWRTHDMAAHLVLRERDYLAAPGLLLSGPWGRFSRQRQAALKTKDFHELVATLRLGPPPGFFRIGWVRDFPSLNEFFVHHEDVRRANGSGPRRFPPEQDAALFSNVARAARYLSRRLHGVGLEIARAETDDVVPVRREQPTVRLQGEPGELLLFLFGRQDAAHVDITGAPHAVRSLHQSRFGM